MKKFIILFFVLISGFFANCFASQIYLLGMQRSGNHLTIYSLSRILNIPCICQPIEPLIYLSKNEKRVIKINREVYLKKYLNKGSCFIQNHEPSIFIADGFNDKDDKLILLLRNYRECLMRHYNENPLRAIQVLKKGSYLKNLNFFEKWEPKNRFLIFYEDLVVNPKRVFENLMVFLNKKKEIVEPFFNEKEYHKNQCYKIYEFQGGGRSGDDLLYHSKMMPEHIAINMDNFLQNQYPILWKKYLIRYAYQKREK
jgi:hypothetical protein